MPFLLLRSPRLLAILFAAVTFASGALGAGTVAGCTAAQRATVGVVASDIANLTPVACAILSAAGQSQAGTACGNVASDVSSVARMVQSILDGLPVPAPGMLPPGPVAPSAGGFVYRGVTVALPAHLVAKVQTRLPAGQ